MVGTARQLLVVTVLMMAAGPIAFGQAQAPLPAPRPMGPGDPVSAIPVNGDPHAWPPPEYKYPATHEPLPFSEPDPLLDAPELPPPGWFANVEATVIGTHLRNKLVNSVTVGPLIHTVHAEGADLDWTVAPRFDVGYRVPDGFGEFLVSYYELGTDGQADVLGPAAATHLKSRLDINEVDLVYSTREITLIPPWDMRWKVGVRGLNVFFDAASDQVSTEHPAIPDILPLGSTSQRTSSDFLGAGPLIGLELTCKTGMSGLVFWGHAEGAYLWGHLHQEFAETLRGAGTGPLEGLADTTTTQGVAVVNAQAGLRWTPSDCNYARFFLGYEFDYYTQVGRDDNTGSRGDIYQHGVFFRGEFNF
jgi:hypothetical protein